MKKVLGVAIGGFVLLAVAAGLAVVGYRQGWFSRMGVKPPAGSAGGRFAGGPEAGGQASPEAGGGATGPAAQAAARQFDGNVAALAWGGKVESATGTADDDLGSQDALLNLIDGDKDTNWQSTDDPGPKEIVLSFADHESVLIDRVTILVDPDTPPRNSARDVEVWVSSTGPKQGFTRVATATLPGSGENTVRFDPVEARYVQLRLLHTQEGGETFSLTELKVMESQRSGYTPLLARRPDLVGPHPSQSAGTAVPAAGVPPACVPVPPAPPPPGHGESKHVMVLASAPWTNGNTGYGGIYLKNHPDYLQKRPDLAAAGRADYTVLPGNRARPWMLAPKYAYDTVVLEQVCEGNPSPLAAEFKPALAPWVAEGHKLIIHDADKCPSGADYSWLPYLFKTNNPGAQGAEGTFLRFVEENWMAHGRRGRPGYIDVAAWENGTDDYRNELGDSNTLTAWDPHWCGHMVVRNVNNIFGFAYTYAHYDRGLIIYDGFDIDMMGTVGYDTLVARELAQGFDPDNLPCAARIGDFVVTTDTRLMERPLLPGRSYDYPLTLLSNQGYKGTVGLSVTASPGLDGMQASFAPASVGLDGLAETKFSLTLPANAPSTPQALQVKGLDAAGKSNTLCLQLIAPQTGELSIVSTLERPPKTRKNLEIILDASGSMKTALGKKTRWSTAHDVLSQVLATLPSDFNVGLRIYGHRESSRSPKTCTDSELVVPIQKLDQKALLSAAEAVKPRGETPLVYSVLQSPADLKEVGGGTVIVITDGEESCHGDPVKAAAQLKASGLDITLNIVGFTLTGQAVQKQLGSFAQATGGRFYAADSGPALARALQMAAVERFPYTVTDAAGKEVAAGEAGAGAEELPPGEYTVVVNAGGTSLKAEHVRVALAQQTTLHIAQKNDQFVLEQ
ncbi:MAG: discoidin domain-containing protein [Terriglobia bacterium]|jgi:hypothetical protein